MVESPFLYPNVTSIPRKPGDADAVQPKKPSGLKSDFDHVLEGNLGTKKTEVPGAAGEKITAKDGKLDSVRQPLKFSAHASQRLAERKIQLDPQTMMKVSDAIDKAEAKGIEDTLVLTSEAALIVNVKNRTVITAMDKGSMNGNIFTNIDGAVIV